MKHPCAQDAVRAGWPVIVALVVACSVVIVSGCSTARDEPGSPITHFRPVDNERVFAGARPRDDGLRWLTTRGVRRMLTLERELFETVPGAVTQERRQAEEMGCQCFHIPMHPLFTPLPVELERVVAFMADPAHHPLCVHGDQGVDRTGLAVAAYRVRVQGWSAARA